jgi:hypothetical protein
MTTKSIELTLSVDEVNVVLGSLSKQPYEAVSAVINKIQQQGVPQVQSMNESAQPKELLQEGS